MFFELAADEEIAHFEPQEFIDGGDKIVVCRNSASTVRATGKSYENEWVHIFNLRDEKITK